MKKLFLIGLKDLKLIFRDRAALIFMLLAPFLLTIGMGFVTGRFSGGSSGLSDIPVVVVNQDKDQLGNALADVFSSQELADLMEPTTSSNPEAARQLVDDDQEAAAVKAIVDEFVSRVEEGRTAGITSISQLIQAGLLTPQDVASQAQKLFQN